MSRFLVRKAGEVAQLNQPGGVRVVAFQFGERLVEGEQVVPTRLRDGEVVGQFDAHPAAAVDFSMRRAASTRILRMASAAAAKKCRGRSSPVASAPDEPEVGLVDQSGRLKRLARTLLCHPRCGELS